MKIKITFRLGEDLIDDELNELSRSQTRSKTFLSTESTSHRLALERGNCLK